MSEMVFRVKAHQRERLDLWLIEHMHPGLPRGENEGRFRFMFTPTILGTYVQVHCGACEGEIDLTEWEGW
jgi:hypothetical protein